MLVLLCATGSYYIHTFILIIHYADCEDAQNKYSQSRLKLLQLQ